MISQKLYEMKQGGKILGDLLDKEILCRIVEGVSTISLDRFVEQFILDNNAVPILKGYSTHNKVYNHSSCISLNSEVVHAPPSHRVLKERDLVTVDVSLRYGEHCVDAARTFFLGDGENQLIEISKKAFKKGFNNFKIGNKIGDVSNSVQIEIEKQGLKVIKDFCGHSIGRELHEDIYVLNHGEKNTGELIYPYLAIALEPMLSERDEYTNIEPDGWTATTISGSLSAHYEDTIIALEKGPENLTSRFIDV